MPPPAAKPAPARANFSPTPDTWDGQTGGGFRAVPGSERSKPWVVPGGPGSAKSTAPGTAARGCRARHGSAPLRLLGRLVDEDAQVAHKLVWSNRSGGKRSRAPRYSHGGASVHHIGATREQS